MPYSPEEFRACESAEAILEPGIRKAVMCSRIERAVAVEERFKKKETSVFLRSGV
jgi:hypothetical protein